MFLRWWTGLLLGTVAVLVGVSVESNGSAGEMQQCAWRAHAWREKKIITVFGSHHWLCFTFTLYSKPASKIIKQLAQKLVFQSLTLQLGSESTLIYAFHSFCVVRLIRILTITVLIQCTEFLFNALRYNDLSDSFHAQILWRTHFLVSTVEFVVNSPAWNNHWNSLSLPSCMTARHQTRHTAVMDYFGSCWLATCWHQVCDWCTVLKELDALFETS